MRIAGSKLAIYFAISGAIDRFERGTAAAICLGSGRNLLDRKMRRNNAVCWFMRENMRDF